MAKKFEDKEDRTRFLVDLLMKHRQLTIDEINAYWLDYINTDHKEFDRWRLRPDLDYIRTHYGIDVQKEKRGKYETVYFIDNLDEIGNRFKLLSWNFGSMLFGDALMKNKKLLRRVSLQGFPSGLEWLEGLLHAMDKRYKVKVHYQKYRHIKGKDHVLEPFFIKDYDGRVYVVAKSNLCNDTCTFALDRIMDLHETNEKFKQHKISEAEEYFKNSYGVYVDEKRYPPQRVVIRTFDDEPNYLIDRPRHGSQDVLRKSDEYTDFDFYISCTNDFIGYLLGRADRIKILSPSSLAKRIRDMHLKAASLYSDLTEE